MNNPFGARPQSTVEQTANRFPDVLSDPDLQTPQYTGYPQGQQARYQPQYQQQQQQVYPQATGYQSQQPVYPQSTGYGQVQGQFQPQYGYGGQQPSYNTSDLDPYASLNNFSSNSNSNSNQTSFQSQSSNSILQVTQTQSHPRQFVSENKAALMAWDDYAWKQLFTRVDALREGWEQRVAGIKAAANQGADPTSVESLRRDAESHVDSIHAAKMQMNEVKSGWKHSTDPASKARVREALNAGLSAMPEYPQPISTEQLGGTFYRSQQKSSIMSQFGSSPNQQSTQNSYYGGGGGGGGMQSQQATGFGGGYGGVQSQNTGYNLQPQQTGYGYGGYSQQQGQQGYQQQGGFGQQQYY